MVVGNPAATVITSSPSDKASSPNFGEVKEDMAMRLADDPEFAVREWMLFAEADSRDTERSLQNCLSYLPAVR